MLETLVALSMVAVILAIAYASYAAATRSVSQRRAGLDLEAEARFTLERIMRGIRCCYSRAAGPDKRTEKPGEKTKILIEDKDKDFLAKRSPADGKLLEFLALTEGDPSEGVLPGVNRVAYRLDESAGVLFRREASVLLLGDSDDEDEMWTPVARGLTSVKFTFHDGKEWKDGWDSTEEKGLPRAVAVEMVFETEEGAERVFATASMVSCGGRREVEKAEKGAGQRSAAGGRKGGSAR